MCAFDDLDGRSDDLDHRLALAALACIASGT